MSVFQILMVIELFFNYSILIVIISIAWNARKRGVFFPCISVQIIRYKRFSISCSIWFTKAPKKFHIKKSNYLSLSFPNDLWFMDYLIRGLLFAICFKLIVMNKYEWFLFIISGILLILLKTQSVAPVVTLIPVRFPIGGNLSPRHRLSIEFWGWNPSLRCKRWYLIFD